MSNVHDELNPETKQLDAAEERLIEMQKNVLLLKQKEQEQEHLLQQEADKMSLLVSSDEDLTARFDINMKAFSEYHPEIFEFFSTYQPEKSVIDTSNGFLNSLNTETGNYLYEYPSYLVTKVQFDAFKKSPSIKKFNFTCAEENEGNFLHANYLDKMIDLLPAESESLNEESRNLSSLIVFGVGAGYHLELISQYYQISCINIVETDLDLFFLSLFSINWEMVLSSFDRKGTRVFISLGDQKETFFEDFMKKSGESGRYQQSHIAGYIHYQAPKLMEVLNEFNQHYHEMGQGWGFFDDAVMSIGHLLGNLNNYTPLLKKSAIIENHLDDVPVFIVGNGPSLDELSEAIKAHENKAIIISCGSALSALYKYGIKPDFHCEQERTSPVKEKVTHYCPVEFLKGITFIAPATVHPDVFRLFDRSVMAAKRNEPSSVLLLKDQKDSTRFASYYFINPTVANTALVVGYNLGFKNFYLFGIDLGHKKGGFHHSKKSLYYNDEQQDRDLYAINEEKLIEVDGNFGGKFLCDTFFYQSNASLSKQITGFSDLNCFNLCDGAQVKGSIPMSIDEFKLSFDKNIELEKESLLDKAFEKAVYIDTDLELHKRLIENLDYELFAQVCEHLVNINQKPVSTLKEAAALLLDNTSVIRNSTEHINDLLIGSVMHFQVVLTQLLYGSAKEKEGLENFAHGLAFYREFLKIAPVYYRENAQSPHYIENTKWIKKLRQK